MPKRSKTCDLLHEWLMDMVRTLHSAGIGTHAHTERVRGRGRNERWWRFNCRSVDVRRRKRKWMFSWRCAIFARFGLDFGSQRSIKVRGEHFVVTSMLRRRMPWNATQRHSLSPEPFRWHSHMPYAAIAETTIFLWFLASFFFSSFWWLSSLIWPNRNIRPVGSFIDAISYCWSLLLLLLQNYSASGKKKRKLPWFWPTSGESESIGCIVVNCLLRSRAFSSFNEFSLLVHANGSDPNCTMPKGFLEILAIRICRTHTESERWTHDSSVVHLNNRYFSHTKNVRAKNRQIIKGAKRKKQRFVMRSALQSKYQTKTKTMRNKKIEKWANKRVVGRRRELANKYLRFAFVSLEIFETRACVCVCVRAEHLHFFFGVSMV